MAGLYLRFLLISYCLVTRDSPRLVRELRNYFFSFNHGLAPVTRTGSLTGRNRCNVDIRLDQAEQSVALAATHKIPVSCFMFCNEIFRDIQPAGLDGLPRVKRGPGKFRQNELRADVLALLDVGEHAIMAFFPIELVNDQSPEAEQGSGGPPLLDVFIQRFEFLRPGLQVIILIHQQIDRVAVSMTPYHPVNPAHKPVVLLYRHSLGLLFLNFFLFAEQKTLQAGRSIV